MTWTATTLNILDGAGVSRPVITYTDGTNFSFANPILDNTGTIVAPATSGNQATMITALGLLSTSALQTSANTTLTAIAASVAAGATAAGQATGNTSLATIATNTAGAATSALQTTGNNALGAVADTAVTNPSLSGSIIALLKGVMTAVNNILPKGQATAANSAPVVLASDQTLPLPTGAATSANQTTGNTSLGNIDADLGAKADTAATTDTGTFSLIALFKRSLQSLTSILAACQAATPAGTNLIGKVGIDQTTPGTTNGVQVTGSLPAGSNSIGSVTANAGTNLNTSALALDTSVNGILVAQGSTTSGQKGTLIQGAVSTSSPAYTNAQTSPLSLDTAGNLRVNVVAGGASGGTSSNFASAFPGTGTAMGAKNGANMVNLTADASGNLNTNLQTAIPAGTNIIGGVTIADGSDATTGAKADAAVTNPASSGSLIALMKGILTAANNILGKGQATMANSAPVVIANDQSAIPVSNAANTSGGTSTYAALGGTGNALLTNSAVAVKASAGNLYGFDFVNTGAAATYVQIFDVAAGSVTLGTTVPKMVKWVPAGGSWEEKFTDEAKVSFANAITVAATTTATGLTAPSTGILANIVYK